MGVCGPDDARTGEHRVVVDVRTNEVALRFEGYGDWPLMCGAEFSGVRQVVVAPDGLCVVVTDHDDRQREAAIPGAKPG